MTDMTEDPLILSGPDARRLCGNVSTQTWWRWQRDKSLGFPPPIRIQSRPYWRLADLRVWLDSRQQPAA